MKPTIVLVGRPNVGKSTLFNRLTGTRDALVADLPGVTRDRHYGHGRLGSKPYLVVDTGGFEPLAKDGILHRMAQQTGQAIDEADVVIFLVDGRQGLAALDSEIADRLRKAERPVIVAVNKSEGMNRSVVAADFHELGLGTPIPVSAAHGEGVRELIERALEPFASEEGEGGDGADGADVATDGAVRVAIVGRPNVGKSTLINGLLGEERLIAFDQPGTTRDAIEVDFLRAGKRYTLIDTAGLRRRGRVVEALEKFSVIKTLQAVERAQVVILMVDAQQDIADQDAHIAAFVREAGRALVVAANKWDGIDAYRREQMKEALTAQLAFIDFARFHYISALHARGLESLLRSVDAAYRAATADLPTPKLTRVLGDAVARQPPPRNGLFRPKLRYAHQGGKNPPLIVVHGNGLDEVPPAYRRYLEHAFREAFALQGTPLRIQFNVSANPFADAKQPRRSPAPAAKNRVSAKGKAAPRSSRPDRDKSGGAPAPHGKR